MAAGLTQKLPAPDTHDVFLELRGARLEQNRSARNLVSNMRSSWNASTLLKCEIGRGNPTFQNLVDWADALGYDIVAVAREAPR